MSRLQVPVAVLCLAACSHSNEAIVRRLAAGPAQRHLDAVLQRPNEPIAWAGDPAGARLPMRGNHLPTVAGQLNGTRMKLVLDTGATHVFLSGRAASSAGVYVRSLDRVDITTPGTVTPFYPCAFDSLELGGLRFGPGFAAIRGIEYGSFRPAGGERTYAIVGTSVLGHFVITFDFKAREVRLKPHGKPVRLGGLIAPVKINGVETHLLVDSGAGALVLEPWLARRLGLADATFQKTTDGGRPRRERIRVDSLEVGGETFAPVWGWVVNTFDGRKIADRRIGGLLGLAGFGDTVWTVDFQRNHLGVKR